MPRQADVVQVAAKGEQLKAPVHVVMGLSTMQALLGPGGGVVTQTPLWTPVEGTDSGVARLAGRGRGYGKGSAPVGVQVSGGGQLGEPVTAQGVCAAQPERKARTRLAVMALSIILLAVSG